MDEIILQMIVAVPLLRQDLTMWLACGGNLQVGVNVQT